MHLLLDLVLDSSKTFVAHHRPRKTMIQLHMLLQLSHLLGSGAKIPACLADIAGFISLLTPPSSNQSMTVSDIIVTAPCGYS